VRAPISDMTSTMGSLKTTTIAVPSARRENARRLMMRCCSAGDLSAMSSGTSSSSSSPSPSPPPSPLAVSTDATACVASVSSVRESTWLQMPVRNSSKSISPDPSASSSLKIASIRSGDGVSPRSRKTASISDRSRWPLPSRSNFLKKGRTISLTSAAAAAAGGGGGGGTRPLSGRDSGAWSSAFYASAWTPRSGHAERKDEAPAVPPAAPQPLDWMGANRSRAWTHERQNSGRSAVECDVDADADEDAHFDFYPDVDARLPASPAAPAAGATWWWERVFGCTAACVEPSASCVAPYQQCAGSDAPYDGGDVTPKAWAPPRDDGPVDRAQ